MSQHTRCKTWQPGVLPTVSFLTRRRLQRLWWTLGRQGHGPVYIDSEAVERGSSSPGGLLLGHTHFHCHWEGTTMSKILSKEDEESQTSAEPGSMLGQDLQHHPYPTHPAHHLFKLLPSGQSCKVVEHDLTLSHTPHTTHPPTTTQLSNTQMHTYSTYKNHSSHWLNSLPCNMPICHTCLLDYTLLYCC